VSIFFPFTLLHNKNAPFGGGGGGRGAVMNEQGDADCAF